MNFLIIWINPDGKIDLYRLDTTDNDIAEFFRLCQGSWIWANGDSDEDSERATKLWRDYLSDKVEWMTQGDARPVTLDGKYEVIITGYEQ